MQTILRVKMGYPLHHHSMEAGSGKTQLDWAEVSRFH
jgi:hypothetical protein